MGYLQPVVLANGCYKHNHSVVCSADYVILGSSQKRVNKTMHEYKGEWGEALGAVLVGGGPNPKKYNVRIKWILNMDLTFFHGLGQT